MKSVSNYVDGAWVDPKVERFRSVNPATGEAFASAPASDAAAVDAAVVAARRAFDAGDWRWRKGSERAAALLAFADALAARGREISELIAGEMGKPVRVNLAREVEGAVDKLRYFAGAARMLEGKVTAATAPEVWDMVLPEPIGVAALIIPWNDPVDLAVRKLGAALAAGCTTVVKSSEITPASTAALIETAHATGAFPPGVINLVHGPGNPTGEALVDHPGVDKISFTGSTATGIRIMERAAKRLAKVSLECGGKFPALIMPDADLERCLDAVTYGAFMYAGQSCTACTRLIVHESLHDRVVEGVVARTKQLPIGDPLDPAVLVGPMASRKQYDKAVSYIRLGLAEGGRAVIGGDPGDKSDLFLPPTVLVDLPADGARRARRGVRPRAASSIAVATRRKRSPSPTTRPMAWAARSGRRTSAARSGSRAGSTSPMSGSTPTTSATSKRPSAAGISRASGASSAWPASRNISPGSGSASIRVPPSI